MLVVFAGGALDMIRYFLFRPEMEFMLVAEIFMLSGCSSCGSTEAEELTTRPYPLRWFYFKARSRLEEPGVPENSLEASRCSVPLSF